MEFKDMKLGSSGLVYAKYGKEIVADVLQTDKDAMVEKIFRKVKLGEKKQETVRMLEYYFYLTSFYPSFVSFFPHPWGLSLELKNLITGIFFSTILNLIVIFIT